ncbi:hypothetical protein C7212DRAFT_365012 [Tuber magnatum]|uniref:Hyaluronan/mRNA-binding protein domain-containing protein n=1 Tax=Tuber magnatum TaxID=42249 RepID=A0A317SL96_9PEZI|nr:hypothetical protein C7212DRAFT_365012 [Tuber magnatum]
MNNARNDIEDPDASPSAPPREVIKNSTTSKKREEKLSTGDFSASGGHERAYSGNERAFRDRDAGRQNNLSRDTAEGAAPRGGHRGGRGGRREYDRHSATGRTDSDKKYSQGWGDTRGNSEWNDELVGEELARKDATGADTADPSAVAPVDAPAEDEEAQEAAEPEEERVKTLDEYHAELEQRRDGLGPPTEVRRPNEGTKNDKKWAGKELSRKVREEDVFFAGESRERTRLRERKQKNLLDIEPRYPESRENRRGGDRGGRGRGDRGRGRGGDRQPRSDNNQRGGQKSGGYVDVADKSAFPALGS